MSQGGPAATFYWCVAVVLLGGIALFAIFFAAASIIDRFTGWFGGRTYQVDEQRDFDISHRGFEVLDPKPTDDPDAAPETRGNTPKDATP
ncbi:MAG: hypothetical protein AAF561_10180 [Planctomycetota bacterium]